MAQPTKIDFIHHSGPPRRPFIPPLYFCNFVHFCIRLSGPFWSVCPAQLSEIRNGEKSDWRGKTIVYPRDTLQMDWGGKWSLLPASASSATEMDGYWRSWRPARYTVSFETSTCFSFCFVPAVSPQYTKAHMPTTITLYHSSLCDEDRLESTRERGGVGLGWFDDCILLECIVSDGTNFWRGKNCGVD